MQHTSSSDGTMADVDESPRGADAPPRGADAPPKSSIVEENAPSGEAPDGSAKTGEARPDPNDIQDELLKERQRSAYYENRFKRALADFQNLERRVQGQIESGINRHFDKFLLDILDIFDDFERARNVYQENGADTTGLDSILRNMGALLAKHNVHPVPAVGEKFDPNLHEAVSFSDGADIEEDIITQEIRRGYTSNDRLIRPTLAIISRKTR